jgi:subtilisin family serine protease
MKKALLLSVSFVILMATQAFSQNNFHNRHILDPYNPEYAEGVVLIKFKDNVKVEANVKRGNASTGLESIDRLLGKYEASDIKKLFKAEKRTEKRYINNPKGGKMEVPQIFNIYKIEFASKDDAKQIAEELSKVPNIDFAEPSYIHATSEILEESYCIELDGNFMVTSPQNGNGNYKGGNAFIPNDPFFDQQQWISSIQLDQVWDTITGDSTQVIAILDTGVDWLHPDLSDNIWYNYGEIPSNNFDDDGNGFIDDIRGWDFINNDNNPMDDNGHGTHVAGIAAAKGNNGIGIAGVNWSAKIMPIKVFPANGITNSETIAAGIHYAANNGATVINMSFGSYGRSFTVETALQNALLTADLIAAAGNNSKSIYVFLGFIPKKSRKAGCQKCKRF